MEGATQEVRNCEYMLVYIHKRSLLGGADGTGGREGRGGAAGRGGAGAGGAGGEAQLLLQRVRPDFESSRKLYFHTRYKHGVAANCNVCGKQFATKAKVQQHKMKVHSGRRELCTKCGADFSRKSNRNGHYKKCRGKGIHCCHFCNKRFCEAATLRSHTVKSHTAVSRRAISSFARYRGREVLWACYTCGGRFRRSQTCSPCRGMGAPSWSWSAGWRPPHRR